MKQAAEFQTYTENRKCQFCGRPIADQEHALMKFCPRKELPDGSIESCKDDYNAEKNRGINFPFLQIFKHHKSTTAMIRRLLIEKGDKVSPEQIDQYGIRLDMPVKIERKEDGFATFFFVDYSLIQISSTTLKIMKHENTF